MTDKPKRATGRHYLHTTLSQAQGLVSDLLDELAAQDAKHEEEKAALLKQIADLEAQLAEPKLP